MICPLCGYDRFNGGVHPLGGDVTPSNQKWCRGRQNRASKAEIAAAIDLFRPKREGKGWLTQTETSRTPPK